jgi:hypothetical protein
MLEFYRVGGDNFGRGGKNGWDLAPFVGPEGRRGGGPREVGQRWLRWAPLK